MKPGNPLTLGVAVGILALVALAASYVPASRASRLQPMDALREE
jgi:ABC-type lipoprotein release transport system permease subunit